MSRALFDNVKSKKLSDKSFDDLKTLRPLFLASFAAVSVNLDSKFLNIAKS